MPDGFRESFVLCREETEGHIPAKRRIPSPPRSGVHEPALKLLDRTSYKYIVIGHRGYWKCLSCILEVTTYE
jgi:hypothetical protein